MVLLTWCSSKSTMPSRCPQGAPCLPDAPSPEEVGNLSTKKSKALHRQFIIYTSTFPKARKWNRGVWGRRGIKVGRWGRLIYFCLLKNLLGWWIAQAHSESSQWNQDQEFCLIIDTGLSGVPTDHWTFQGQQEWSVWFKNSNYIEFWGFFTPEAS